MDTLLLRLQTCEVDDFVSNYASGEEANVAKLLRWAKQLERQLIGNVLGHIKSHQILHLYTRAFNMAGGSVESCLRNYVGRFQLPKEAQMIERILMAFSSAYDDQQANTERSTTKNQDSPTYLLVYSMLLLNTDAHHPKACGSFRRMTKKEYCINFPHHEHIYDAITHFPLQSIQLKREKMTTGEFEVIFGVGRIGFQLETAFDGMSCQIVHYHPSEAEILSPLQVNVKLFQGSIISAVNEDSTFNIPFATVVYLIKIAHRPICFRFCLPSAFYHSNQVAQ